MLKSRHLWSAALGLAGLLLCRCFAGCGDQHQPSSSAETNENTPTSRDTSAAGPVSHKPPFVVLLGTGTPVPDPSRSGPSTAIVTKNRSYIVDFGPGVVRRAARAHQNGIEPLAPQNLRTAFVTHLHSDHTVGLADLLLTPAVVGRAAPLTVYGPQGLTAMARQIEAAFTEDVGVRGHGRTEQNMTGYQVISNEVTPGLILEESGISVTAFPVKHGHFKHAFGYRFDVQGRSIVISGDTAPTSTVALACRGCDVLVHEAYCQAGFEHGPQSWQNYHATYHTSAIRLGQLAARAKPKLLLVTHILFFGCSEDEILGEIRKNYDGRVVIGKDLGVY